VGAGEGASFAGSVVGRGLGLLPWPRSPSAAERQQQRAAAVGRRREGVTTSLVDVKVDDDFTISLEANPSTGYS
jgi:hypothetical protein